jgi:endonuclease/exonuclease/phosphatase family metal-dependent hydrolase
MPPSKHSEKTVSTTNAKQVCIATYNTKNLFNSQHPDHPKRPREFRELARMIGKVDADILALQEVENTGALAELNERLAQPYAHCALIEGNSHRGINIAYMSRLPFVLSSHRQIILKDEAGQDLYEFCSEHAAATALPTVARFQRDLLLAQFNLGDDTLAVFNMHLKSRIQNEWAGIDSDVLRLAEAQAVLDVVALYEKRNPQHIIIVLGDLNQRTDHPSLQPIMALRYFDPVLAELVPNNTQLSTHWSKPRDRIDHLLLSHLAHARYLAGSATVHREAGARKASDHYPVSVRLQF